MQNPVFAEIVGTKFITIGGMDGNRYLYNKNKLLKSYPGATGVKTGFTKSRKMFGGFKQAERNGSDSRNA